jgi:uncharacterized protein YrrD
MTQLDLNSGAEVRCKDGDCGTLIKVVIDPQAKKVSEIIVEKGLLLSQDRVIPVEEIARANGEEVYLDLKASELEKFNQYQEGDFITPDPDQYGWEASTTYQDGQVVTPSTPFQPRPIYREPFRSTIHYHAHEGVSPSEEVIEPGTRVYNPGGTIGKVDHLRVDPESRDITHVVMDRGLMSGHTLVPVEQIENVGEDGVYITASKSEIDEMEMQADE